MNGKGIVKRKRNTLYEIQGGICCHCQMPMSRRRISLEHVVPQSMGGTSAWSNLLVAHKRCNSKRGSEDMPERAKRVHFGVIEELSRRGLVVGNPVGVVG